MERGRDATNHRSREAGYTMVMFVMIIAIMSIMMGVAVQTAEFQMRREREAELIFRGEQYVEAIRLFKAKYGRFPMRLQEIWEADPKVIRKKFKDPITDSEEWGLIFLGQEGRNLAPRDLQGRAQSPTRTVTHRDDQDEGRGGSPFDTGLGQGEKIGPITGVHSKSCDESVKVYDGRTSYCEWRFVLREGQGRRGHGVRPRQPGGPGGQRPPGGDPREPTDPRIPGNQPPGSRPTGTPYP
jgi:hypothetical protein